MGKSGQKTDKPAPVGGAKDTEKAGSEPEWADGLRKLYDSVVDEPLPDSFKSLLDKLDDKPDEGAS